MRLQWKRLAIAACLSLACAGGTLLWYYGTEKKITGNGEAALAQVSKVGEEVLRRPATRLLWQQVNTGDNLYNGETIRTSARGELRIQFDDGRYIDLEPDSLIVLQKSKGEISLDLMEGSLFVNAKSEGTAPAGTGLVLNSKSGKVDLSGASASLSKGSGDSLDVRVLEGKAKIKGADGKEKELSSGKNSSIGANGVQFDSSLLTILSPVANKPNFIDPDAEKPVLFKWRGYPANWKVSVMAGPTRKEMREVGVSSGAEAEVHSKLPLGKYWWKLVAKDPQSGQVMNETSASRFELQARYAPTVIFPTADAEIPLTRPTYDLTFKWQHSEDTNKVQLEVSADPSFKTLLVNKAFRGEDSLLVPALKSGEYYWRMSAFFEGSDKPIVGKIQKFSLQKEKRKDPVQIVWNLPEAKLNQNFVQTPQLDLSWEPKNRQEDIVGYRVKLQDEQNAEGEPLRLEAKDVSAKATLPKGGRYIASIEAVDKDGSVIGKSEPLKLAATELPLIAAPVLQPADGVLKSGFDGRAQLVWEGVQGAKEYWITIVDKSGKQLAHKKYDGTQAALKNLMPGEYSVKIDAVDAYGRPSQDGKLRTLLVPDSSGLKSPTLKKIKVN